MKHHAPRGFSLVEVLVAIFIIGLMLLMLDATLQNIPLIAYARDQDIALKIAGGELEKLRAGGYDALPESGSFSDAQLSALPSGAGTVAVTAYNDKTKQVTATVTWRERTAASDSTLSLTTLITQTGGL